MFLDGQQSVFNRHETTIYRLKSTIYGIEPTIYRLESTIYRFESTIYRFETTVHGLQSSEEDDNDRKNRSDETTDHYPILPLHHFSITVNLESAAGPGVQFP
ncbi:MAG: hypothetical protein F4Z81_08460 [Gemmatimonadetes bacterium]|nr:hypothetical protein [Gemmatimonadota bacterium]